MMCSRCVKNIDDTYVLISRLCSDGQEYEQIELCKSCYKDFIRFINKGEKVKENECQVDSQESV